MTIRGRNFGKSHPLQEMMRRGELFFDAITSTDVDEVLSRSKRISNIAFTAAAIAGEKLQREGDGDSKRLIFAAYLNIGDLTRTLANRSDITTAQEILSSEQTYRTLLLASSALNSVGLDRIITRFRKQDAHFNIDDNNNLLFDANSVPKIYKGTGCPYAKGSTQRAAYFKDCTDHIVSTYVQASEQGMPYNLKDQIVRRIYKAE